MSAAIAIPGNTASTFLTHFFGSGLSDDTYVIERFKAMVDGDIRRCSGEPPAAKKGAAQDDPRHRHPEGRAGAAPGAHRDHRLHRAQDAGRRTALGFGGHGPPVRPQAEGLNPSSRGRPAGPVPGSGAGAGGGASSSVSGLAGRRPSWPIGSPPGGGSATWRATTGGLPNAGSAACASSAASARPRPGAASAGPVARRPGPPIAPAPPASGPRASRFAIPKPGAAPSASARPPSARRTQGRGPLRQVRPGLRRSRSVPSAGPAPNGVSPPPAPVTPGRGRRAGRGALPKPRARPTASVAAAVVPNAARPASASAAAISRPRKAGRCASPAATTGGPRNARAEPKRRAAGLCETCAAPVTGGAAYCGPCAADRNERRQRSPEAHRETDRRRYAERRARGDCTRCGKLANGAAECQDLPRRRTRPLRRPPAPPESASSARCPPSAARPAARPAPSPMSGSAIARRRTPPRRQRYAERRAKGRCVECNTPSPGAARCRPCAVANVGQRDREAENAARRRRYAERRATGRCVECDAPSPWTARCEPCSLRQSRELGGVSRHPAVGPELDGDRESPPGRTSAPMTARWRSRPASPSRSSRATRSR